MRELNLLLNDKRKPIKTVGTIVSNPKHRLYVIKTRNGRMQVQAASAYRLGDRVVVYDGLIQGYAGTEPVATTEEV